MKKKNIIPHNYIELLKRLFFLIATLYLVVGCSNNNSIETRDSIYLNIPDIEFEKKLISLGIDSDSLINHQILKREAEQVSTLNLNTIGENTINNLTGIEGFVNLKKLSVVGNHLTTVNLKFNTQLDTLNLAGNYITTIDLSNNTELIKVDLNTNELNSITGLKNATKLKWLNLSSNLLEALSIHNPALETLFVKNNLLMSLDVQKAVSLTTILAQTNKISEVDFMANIALETLALSDNNLQNINMESNSNIEVFYCSSNLLTSLDISGLENLVRLTVDRNPNLFCVKIHNGQNISNLIKSDYQELNTNCN